MKYYLVDSENVNDNWLLLFKLAQPEDQIIVFYTKNSPHMSYASVISLLHCERQIVFEQCYEGNNALDFQLISYMGYLLKDSDSQNTEFIVMSNDTGFDSAVRFWKDRGFSVRRFNVNYCKMQLQQQKKKESSPLPDPVLEEEVQPQETSESSESPESSESLENHYDFDKEEADFFINCIGKGNLTKIHETLVHVYGQKQGQNIYKTVKDKSYPFEEKTYSRREKIQHFSDIIFAHNQMTAPEDFLEFLENNKDKSKNLNSLRAAIMKSYGNENGTKYYSLFKPYFKTISALK